MVLGDQSGHRDSNTGNGTYGLLAANLTKLELLAVLLAAVIHDHDHPGKNNGFLVATENPLAILYNNRWVASSSSSPV